MRRVSLDPSVLVLSPALSRSRGTKGFEERLRASIESVGLAEPIKVAKQADGTYVVVDGILRLRAVQAIRKEDPDLFKKIPAYVVDFGQRHELRFQTDIYQDLLPSQLATLVEHLHRSENVRKADIASYIGVSPPTVRNYTGLWRLLERGGLFAQLVQLMDVGVIPSSNPFAWLRLSVLGIRMVIQESFSDDQPAEDWIEQRVARARRGDVAPFSIKYVESATNDLDPEYYREHQEVRELKRNLGLRRSVSAKKNPETEVGPALRHLAEISKASTEPVIRSAAKALAGYLQ